MLFPEALLWIVVALLIMAGIVGVFVPGLPGAPLIFGGLLIGAWIDDFQRVSFLTLVFLGILTIISLLVDVVAAALGAKSTHASGLAVLGAMVGTIAGLLLGFVGLIVLPFIGAAAGQFLSDPDLFRAGRAGVATWLGLIFGVVAKVALAFTMVGVFVLAYVV